MSKPMLPGQNSRYWGYDLNNYLLSLDEKINGLESFHQNQQTIVQNVGPGFQTGTWGLITTKDDGTALEMNEYTLEGICSYETYAGGSVRSYTHNFDNNPYKVFEKVYVIEYNTEGKLSYPGATSNISSLPAAFYAVYLFFERESDGDSDTVRTVFCKDYIFRGDCIMIGSYENKGRIFTPRVQTSSKTLYQSGQDTIHSYVTVEYGCSSDRLPLANSKDSNNIYDFKKFYYYSNGVNPSEILSNIKDSKEKFTNRSYDVFSQINSGTWKTYLVSEVGDEISVSDEWTGANLDSGELAAYYLAPSGNIYVQIHAGPTNYPEVKDYNMEAIDPLRDKEGFITGGLVFIGTVFKKEVKINDEDDYVYVYDWVSSASNGISPVLLDINRVNPHKILIENNEYWVGEKDDDDATFYQIKIDQEKPYESSIHKTPVIKLFNSSGYNITPTFQDLKLLNGNGETHFQYNQLTFETDYSLGRRSEPRGGGHYMPYISLTSIDYVIQSQSVPKVEIVNADQYYEVTVDFGWNSATQGPAAKHSLNFELGTDSSFTKDGRSITYKANTKILTLETTVDSFIYGYKLKKRPYIDIKRSLQVANLTELLGPTYIKNNLNITGTTSITGDTSITGTTSITGDTDLNGYVYIKGDDQQDTQYLAVGSLLSITKERGVKLSKGFYIDDAGTYYFNSNGNIKCNDITFTSDIRLKTNLKSVNSKICHDAVQKLSARTYTYTKNNYNTLGLIAQEIEEQLPEYAHLLVHENEDGEKMVSEHKLLFILWEALKQEIKERKGGQ